MALNPKGWTALFLTISGIFSAFVSFLGAFGLMWAGGTRSGITALFFGFPALSLPVFWIYFLWNKLGRFFSLLLPIAIYTSFEIMMWVNSPVTSRTTPDFIGKAILAPFEYRSPVWIQLIATACLFWASWIGQPHEPETFNS